MRTTGQHNGASKNVRPPVTHPHAVAVPDVYADAEDDGFEDFGSILAYMPREDEQEFIAAQPAFAWR